MGNQFCGGNLATTAATAATAAVTTAHHRGRSVGRLALLVYLRNPDTGLLF